VDLFQYEAYVSPVPWSRAILKYAQTEVKAKEPPTAKAGNIVA
jgi:hypothetical protein